MDPATSIQYTGSCDVRRWWLHLREIDLAGDFLVFGIHELEKLKHSFRVVAEGADVTGTKSLEGEQLTRVVEDECAGLLVVEHEIYLNVVDAGGSRLGRDVEKSGQKLQLAPTGKVGKTSCRKREQDFARTVGFNCKLLANLVLVIGFGDTRIIFQNDLVESRIDFKGLDAGFGGVKRNGEPSVAGLADGQKLLPRILRMVDVHVNLLRVR